MRKVTKIQMQQNFKIGIDIRLPVVKLIAKRKIARSSLNDIDLESIRTISTLTQKGRALRFTISFKLLDRESSTKLLAFSPGQS